MAKKYVRVGAFGPFIYDDVSQEAIDTDGNIKANNVLTDGLTTNVRLVASNASKLLEEVNDLTPYIGGGTYITVTDDGDGTVTIEVQNLLEINLIDDTDSPYDISVSALRSIVIVDASTNAVTVNLPAATNWAGQTIVVKKTDNVNNITIQADGTETIDGSNTQTLSTQYDAMAIVSDGTDIHIIGTQ